VASIIERIELNVTCTPKRGLISLTATFT